MTTRIPALLATAVLLAAALPARPADDTVAKEPQASPQSQAVPPATPRTATPENPLPGPPPVAPPPPAAPQAAPAEAQADTAGARTAQPPSGAERGATAAPAQAGHWIYTERYGWTWIPAGGPWTYQGTDEVYVYVYTPALGWAWVVSPWAWGPAPYYGYWPWYDGPRWWGPGVHVYGWWGWGGHGGWGPGWRGPVRPAPPRARPAPRR